MTYYQLEVLEMIVEKGSFKAAATALHRTQPTLSVAIKNLEEEFDLQIFTRDTYRPQLTEAGEVFYKGARQCLDAFRRLEVLGKELGTSLVEPRLTFIIDPLSSFDVVQAIFDKCLHAMQPTELIVRTEILGVGQNLLLSGEADFAIAAQLQRAADIESVPLQNVDLLPVAAKSLVRKARIDETWLQEHPQIIVTSPQASLGVRVGGRHCFVTDHAVKRRMILEGLGWGGLAHHEVGAALERGTLIRLPEALVPSQSVELCIMRSRLKPMGPVARAVWSRLLEQTIIR